MELQKGNAHPWEIMKHGVGKIRKAYVEGDIEGGSLTFGQVCGLIREIPTCRELIQTIVMEAENIMLSLEKKILPNGRPASPYLRVETG